MHVFEFVIIVVALATFGGMFTKWLSHREKHREKHRSDDTLESDRRIDALEKRVQVLERIVTDKAEKLKDDINNL